MQIVRRPHAADIVATVYLIAAGLAFFPYWSAADYREAIVQNLGMLLFIWASWFLASGPGQIARIVRFVRMFYPLLLIGMAFVQVGLFARMLYGPGFTFDPVVARWDAAFFTVNPHMWFHRILPGRIWAEIMHVLYVLYFPLLFGSFLFVAARRVYDYPRFAFVFLASFLSFVVVFVLFPATGPLEYRDGLFSDAVVFSNLVDYLFSFGIPDPGGAFPSSHVGQSIVVLLLLRPLSRRMTALIVFVVIGIGVSMGYAAVHYQIDAVAGVPAGIALYAVWNTVYLRWVASRDTGPDPGSN